MGLSGLWGIADIGEPTSAAGVVDIAIEQLAVNIPCAIGGKVMAVNTMDNGITGGVVYQCRYPSQASASTTLGRFIEKPRCSEGSALCVEVDRGTVDTASDGRVLLDGGQYPIAPGTFLTSDLRCAC